MRLRAADTVAGLLLALASVSCSASDGSESGQGGVVHPDPARYILPVRPEHFLEKTSAVEGTVAAATLELGSSLVRIGELEGPAEYVIGKILDVSLDHGGDLVVLDSRYNNVRIYDDAGRFLLSAGGPGEGPGELLRPTALAVDRRGRIYVADRGNRRLTIFQRTGQEITLHRTMNLTDLWPNDMCALGDRIVINGLRQNETGSELGSELLHVFDEELRHITSFGRTYSTGNRHIQPPMSIGHVLCVPPDKIIFVPSGLPIIYAYSIDGQPLWITMIAQYRPFPYIELPRSMISSIPDEGANHTVSVVGAPDGWIVVQVAFTTPESREAGEPFVRLDTYLLRDESGEGIYLGEDLPLLAYVDDDKAVVVEQDPFPRLDVRRVNAFSRQ